jgi:hypothetical protein
MTDLFPSSPMLHNLDNPFRESPSGTEDDRIIEQMLGKSAADAYRRVTDPKKPEKPRGLVLTPEQEAKIKASQERTMEDFPWDRDDYIAFAKTIGKDAAWVDETFTFHDDETVTVEGNLDLYALTDARLFPNNLTTVGGYLSLNGLTSAEHLTLPTTVGGNLWLNALTSAEHLTLPKTVGGSLWLNALTSAEHLTLPKTVGGSLALNNLPISEKKRLRNERPDLRIL